MDKSQTTLTKEARHRATCCYISVMQNVQKAHMYGARRQISSSHLGSRKEACDKKIIQQMAQGII